MNDQSPIVKHILIPLGKSLAIGVPFGLVVFLAAQIYERDLPEAQGLFAGSALTLLAWLYFTAQARRG